MEHGHHVTKLVTSGFYIVGYRSDINQALYPPGIGEGLFDYNPLHGRHGHSQQDVPGDMVQPSDAEDQAAWEEY